MTLLDANLQDVGMLIVIACKSALIVENGEMVGILSFKYMMTRAMAK